MAMIDTTPVVGTSLSHEPDHVATSKINDLKRKRAIDTPSNKARFSQVDVRDLADGIQSSLTEPVLDDVMHQCGQAPESILALNPDYVLQLAKDKINTWEYRKVPYCWLRLYEDSSLCKVIHLLREVTAADEQHWIDQVVQALDDAVITSGARGRPDLFAAIFKQLSVLVGNTGEMGMPKTLTVVRPRDLVTGHAIPTTTAPGLTAFQLHLDHQMTPLIMRGVMDDWPAVQTWHKTSHLLYHTLGGRRLVPVEIGETYAHVQWRQQLMPFREYLQRYLIPIEPEEVGYMGQHDLFNQIPALKEEIVVPDYCYTAPPETVPESLVGMSPVSLLPEPQVNAWLGPKGTRSPLHHDPYHNIFCQVVGYKYIRLYPPNVTSSVYPRVVDERGINLSNTSSVDIRFDPQQAANLRIADLVNFPLFCAQHAYQEAIIGPGESLYIPAGWWHFIEALSTSFSVSFWWN